MRRPPCPAAVRQFFDERILGPERAALLAARLPATAAADTARKDKEIARLGRRIRQLDAAENAHAREIEALAHTDAPPPASPPCAPASSPGSPS